jgi:transcriptional regulator with XRE-family HTH domain
MDNLFGTKVKNLREARGLSQTDLARRMGYVGNSYIYDLERGAFMPSEQRFRDLARALEVPVALLRDLALEARIEDLGIRDPEFVALFKDYSRLSRQDRAAILKAYKKVKPARRWNA